MKKLSTLVAASAAAGALALSGCGNSGDDKQADEQPQMTSQAEDDSTSSDDAGESEDGKGGSLEAAQAAIDLAEKEVGGKAIDIDFDDDKTWDLTVLKGSEEHEIEINAEGTEVVNKKKDDDQADKEDIDALDKAKTPLKDALKAAVDKQAGTIDEADLDNDGKPVWKVEIYPEGKSDSVEVYVSAADGKVVDKPADDDDDDDSDD